MPTAKAYGAATADQRLAPMTIERRDLRSEDVAIRIRYCGVCHSDLHQARNDWGNSTYPVVPGHEIVGEVTAVGDQVSKYKVGDKVGGYKVVREVLTARKGQRPQVWISWDEASATMLRWSGYKLLAVERTL